LIVTASEVTIICTYVPRGDAFNVEVGETQLNSFIGQADDVEDTA